MAYYNELENYGNRLAIIDDKNRQLTYAQLSDFSKTFGEKVQSRSFVFCFCENSIESIEGYVACLGNGLVPLLLDKHIDKELGTSLIKLYQPNYIYAPKESDTFVCGKVIVENGSYVLTETSYGYEHKLNPQLALLLTTSGSTGSPKLVRQSYTNIQANAESIAQYLNIDAEERPITTLPMNYTYGLSIINSHLLKGATILATTHGIVEREFWSFFKEAQATSFGGVPYTYEMLKRLRFFGMELPSLRYMTQAGGKLSPELHKEFAEYAMQKNKQFIVMYGQCEATARMAYLPADKSLEKYGSMGIAIPGGTLELVDVGGNKILSADEVGELVYYGPNVTLGYAENPLDLEKDDERQGRLETGDMAKRDSEGFFYIVGRKKRFLKLFGNRVNLDEAERMIKAHYENIDIACSGVDDHLYVFATVEEKDILEEIKHFLTEKMNMHGSAISVLYISEIPKNEAGKTLYIKLEKYYS